MLVFMPDDPSLETIENAIWICQYLGGWYPTHIRLPMHADASELERRK
jgi:hypothetical protein